MNIIKNICKNWYERDGFKPEMIVVHISGGTDKSMTSWFHTPGSGASSHYGVDKENGAIYQYVEEDKAAWTNGRIGNPTFKLYKPGVNPNKYSITIENEGYDLADATELQLQTLCILIKDIASRHNIPIDRDHIIGHFEIDSINRNYCPSPNHAVMDTLVRRLKEPTDKNKIKEQIKVLLEQL